LSNFLHFSFSNPTSKYNPLKPNEYEEYKKMRHKMKQMEKLGSFAQLEQVPVSLPFEKKKKRAGHSEKGIHSILLLVYFYFSLGL
jgi:hypothetical protein